MRDLQLKERVKRGELTPQEAIEVLKDHSPFWRDTKAYRWLARRIKKKGGAK